jgi:hypothetical protein
VGTARVIVAATCQLGVLGNTCRRKTSDKVVKTAGAILVARLGGETLPSLAGVIFLVTSRRGRLQTKE